MGAECEHCGATGFRVRLTHVRMGPPWFLSLCDGCRASLKSAEHQACCNAEPCESGVKP